MKKGRGERKEVSPSEQEKKEKERRDRNKRLAPIREKVEHERKKGTKILMTEEDFKRMYELQEWIDRKPKNEEEGIVKRLAREELIIYSDRIDFGIAEKKRIKLEKEIEDKLRIEKEKEETEKRNRKDVEQKSICANSEKEKSQLKEKDKTQSKEVKKGSIVESERKNLGRSPIGASATMVAASIELPSDVDSESEIETEAESVISDKEKTIIEGLDKEEIDKDYEGIVVMRDEIKRIEGSSQLGGNNGEIKLVENEEESDLIIKCDEFIQQALNIQETVVEITTAKECRKETARAVRKEVRNLLEIIIKQQKTLIYYKAKYEEGKKQSNVENKKETYAGQLKKGLVQTESVKVSKRSEKKPKHLVSIFPVEKASSEETKNDISKNVSIKDIKDIKGIKSIRRGGIMVEVEDNQDVEQLIKNIVENENIRGKYKAMKTPKRKPQIIIFSVSEEIEEGEMIEDLKARNNLDFEEKDLVIKKKFKGRIGNTWILELNPILFKQVMKLKKLKIGWVSHDFKENINPVFCYYCGRPGHISAVCYNTEVCTNCGSQQHNNQDCKEKSKCLNCHYRNEKWGTKLDTNHSCLSKNCELYLREIEKISSRIDYGD